MIKITGDFPVIVTPKPEVEIDMYETKFGYTVKHFNPSCLIYKDKMYVLENADGMKIEIIADYSASEPVFGRHIAIHGFEEAIEEYKNTGYEFVKDDSNDSVKCALLKRDNSVIFLVEHNG